VYTSVQVHITIPNLSNNNAEVALKAKICSVNVQILLIHFLRFDAVALNTNQGCCGRYMYTVVYSLCSYILVYS